MKKSHYFSDLIRNYMDEVDDLITDSEGKSVLQKRLNEKRREISAILPMIEFSPEMVSVVFYGAFGFSSPETMQRLVLSDPSRSDFLDWADLKGDLTVADWAAPLIAAALKEQGGDTFLVATAGLEFLRTKDSSAPPVAEKAAEKEPRHNDSDNDDGRDDDEAHDLGEAGADWLAEQGFDALDR